MRRQFVVTIVFAFCAGASAFAQKPTLSFAELGTVLKPSDYVRVVDRSGKETTGKLAALTDASIQVSNKSKTREVARADILRIVRIDKDSTLNGKLLGGAVGAGLMTVDALQESGCDYAISPFRWVSVLESSSVPSWTATSRTRRRFSTRPRKPRCGGIFVLW